MWFIRKPFFALAPGDRANFTRLLSNSFSKHFLWSFSTLLGKKNDSSQPRSKCSDDLSILNLPQKPKKPATSFIRFAMSMKSAICQENPQMAKPELLRYAAKLWKSTDVETRVQYQIEYYTALEKYYDDVQKYNSCLTEEQIVALKKFDIRKKENRVRRKIKEKFKELEKPKRPLNAFTLFLVSRKDELKKTRADVYYHKIVEEWKKLPEKEKDEFRKQGKKLQEEYKVKLAEWKERVGPLNIMQVLKNGSFEDAKEFLNEQPITDPVVSVEDDEDEDEDEDKI